MEAKAACGPWAKACIPLVTIVGKIKPASASSGGKIRLSPEIVTIGIAKPTMPFISPAQIETIKAKAQRDSDISFHIKSIRLHYHNHLKPALKIRCEILQQKLCCSCIFIALQLQNAYEKCKAKGK